MSPRPRTTARPGDARGLWIGTVTAVDAGGRPSVEVPRLTPGYHYGPLPHLIDDAGQVTGGGGGPSHTHPQLDRPYVVGDRVLVGFLEGRSDDLVVLGRLA